MEIKKTSKMKQPKNQLPILMRFRHLKKREKKTTTLFDCKYFSEREYLFHSLNDKAKEILKLNLGSYKSLDEEITILAELNKFFLINNNNKYEINFEKIYSFSTELLKSYDKKF